MPKANSPLPPIQELFIRSWDTFVDSILPLFVFSLVMIGISLAFVIISGIAVLSLAGAAGLFQLFSRMGIAALPLVSLPIYILFILFLAVFFVGIIAISSIGRTVPVLIVSSYPKKIPLRKQIRVSLSLIIPLFFTGFLVFLVTFGGFFVFVFPAILFSFFLMFVNYEVILGGRKLLPALRRSVLMVSRHFGEILVRIFVFILLYILIVVFIPNLITKIEPRTGILLTILSMFTNTLIGWFGLCFSVTLYKQAKEGLDGEKGSSIVWMGVISLLGWIIFILLVYAIFKLSASSMTKSFLDNLKNETKSSSLQYGFQEL